MKKFIIALMLVVSLAGFAAQAHAVTLDDLWREITSLRQQVSDMKTQLGAAVIRASDMITSSKIDASLTTDATKISTTSVTAKPTGIIGVMQPITADGLTPTIKQTTTTTDPVVGGGQLQPTAVSNPTGNMPVTTSHATTNYLPVTNSYVVSQQAAAQDQSWYCQNHPEDPACKTAVVVATTNVSFTRNLNQGERSDEVMKLQKILVGKGFLTADNATGLYGRMTVAAVRQFQAEAGIAGGDGTSVGPKTRAALAGSTVVAQAQVNGNVGAAGIFPPGCTSWHGYSTTTGQPCNQLGPIQSASSILSNHLPCLLSNTTPTLKVTSPNGGESYSAGQQITVTWETCNVPADHKVSFKILSSQNGIVSDLLPFPGPITYSFNDGSEVVTLPTLAGLNANQWQPGTFYKVLVITSTDNVYAEDQSDNWFTINGQTQAACSIFQPTIIASNSTATQYVAAGTTNGVTDATKVTYNFTSPQQATISEMKFAVDVPMSVTSVRVGSVTAPVVSGQAWLTGLNIVVPQGGAGVNVDAFFSYAPVGVSGIPSNTQSMVDLNSVKFTCSGTGVTNTAVITVGATNKMFVVGSKPIVTVNTTPNNGLTLGAENKIGEVTITADAHEDIKINDIQFNPWPSGFASNPTLGNPRIAEGGVTITGSHCSFVPMALCEFGSASNTDYDGYIIPAGTSKTFGLYANLIYGVNNGNGSIATSLSSFEFNWDDTATNGASGTNLVGSYIYGFPTGSYLIH